MSRLSESFLMTLFLGAAVVGMEATPVEVAALSSPQAENWLIILRIFVTAWALIYFFLEALTLLRGIPWFQRRRHPATHAILPAIALATPTWRRIGPLLAAYIAAPLLLAGQLGVIATPWELLIACFLLSAVTLRPSRSRYRKMLRRLYQRHARRQNQTSGTAI